jgi:hypothetical protein
LAVRCRAVSVFGRTGRDVFFEAFQAQFIERLERKGFPEFFDGEGMRAGVFISTAL